MALDMSPTANKTLLNTIGGLVAVGLVVILGFATYALIFHDIPKDNHDVLLSLVMVLSANIGVIVGFFFGTSVTSKQKDDVINALTQTTGKT